MEKEIENNTVEICGKIVSDIEYSHELYDEKFYKFSVETKRLSVSSDILPVVISERVIDVTTLNNGDIVHITGQFRSYNEPNGNGNGRSKLLLVIFTKSIDKKEQDSDITVNNATFEGYICKTPIYRKTPLGREISDILIAVNRTYKKSDYIPCILWGRNAKFSTTLPTGTLVKLSGRLQSRKYEKKHEDGTVEEKVAYELSVSSFSALNDSNNILEAKEKEEEENNEEKISENN